MEYFRTYDSMPEDAAFIRRSVFMEEQGFKDEFDDTDRISKHIGPAAVCRYYPDGDGKCYIVGRIAVLKEFRKRHYGQLILREAERQAGLEGALELSLAAQVQAAGFYEKSGFAAVGEVFMEEHCPHIKMVKSIL